MQILGLLGIYFDAVVVEVKTFLLLFRLALAILCQVARILSYTSFSIPKKHASQGLTVLTCLYR